MADTVEDHIDMDTFNQIREMDEPDDNEFSRGLITGFREQADNTFTEFQDAIEANDLEQLSALGHYLKGSSATMGLIKLENSCEKIQHLGSGKNEDGTDELDDETCLQKIGEEVDILFKNYETAWLYLQKFHDEGTFE